MQIRRIGFVFAILTLLQGTASAQDALDALRGRGEEFCFGRTYDAAQLVRSKRQALSGLFVFRDFSGDPLSEDKPMTREQSMAREQNAARPTFDVIRRYRGGRIKYSDGTCEETRDGVDCSPDSEELAEFALELRASGDKLVAKNGLDEKVAYQLERLPLSVCRSWRDRARPEWVGKGQPLRARFAERAPVCFGQDFDISKHSKQTVAGVAVRINRPVEIDPDEKIPFTMFRATISVKLKSGTTRVRHTRCDSGGYYFWCQHGQGAVRLATAADRGIRMFSQANPNTTQKRTEMEEFFDLPLGGKQQAFYLVERDDAKCEF
jgi:hypothetical protein